MQNFKLKFLLVLQSEMIGQINQINNSRLVQVLHNVMHECVALMHTVGLIHILKQWLSAEVRQQKYISYLLN
jgi:hypothetical protein